MSTRFLDGVQYTSWEFAGVQIYHLKSAKKKKKLTIRLVFRIIIKIVTILYQKNNNLFIKICNNRVPSKMYNKFALSTSKTSKTQKCLLYVFSINAKLNQYLAKKLSRHYVYEIFFNAFEL